MSTKTEKKQNNQKKNQGQKKGNKQGQNKGNKQGKKQGNKQGQIKKKKSSKKNSAKNQNTLPKIDENFIDWFNDVIFQADVIDYRYNLKGCGVWLAYGFKIRKKVLQIMRDLLDNTPIPHDEYLFPMLIPEPQFMKEAEHVKGFEEEVYWVKDGGTTPLDIKLALRPTSETAIYPMMAKWIRSHQDLPLKTYQVVNTFRFEGKNTKPMIRVREITTFKEAHTCHANAEDCQNQIREAIGIYKAFFDAMGVPYVISSRPPWDTFPGADYTIAFDCIFPDKHRALQVGTVHNLGQTFGTTFDLKFETSDGKQEYVYQTCYGVSERVIAAAIASHGDDNGLILPPSIAPIHVVIVPILFKKKEEMILEECKSFYSELRAAGIKVHLDDRDMSSGRKYFHWEIRGVPLRIEIGPRDMEKQQVCIVSRKDRKKQFIPKVEAIDTIKNQLSEIQEDLKKSATEIHKGLIFRTQDLQEALVFIEENKGLAEIPFCGKEDCAADIEKQVDGMKFLGVPEEYLPALTDNPKEEKDIFCAQCMTRVSTYWRIGRSF
jgi:prolyl-tRNA synthetase